MHDDDGDDEEDGDDDGDDEGDDGDDVFFSPAQGMLNLRLLLHWSQYGVAVSGEVARPTAPPARPDTAFSLGALALAVAALALAAIALVVLASFFSLATARSASISGPRLPSSLPAASWPRLSSSLPAAS